MIHGPAGLGRWWRTRPWNSTRSDDRSPKKTGPLPRRGVGPGVPLLFLACRGHSEPLAVGSLEPIPKEPGGPTDVTEILAKIIPSYNVPYPFQKKNPLRSCKPMVLCGLATHPTLSFSPLARPALFLSLHHPVRKRTKEVFFRTPGPRRQSPRGGRAEGEPGGCFLPAHLGWGTENRNGI